METWKVIPSLPTYKASSLGRIQVIPYLQTVSNQWKSNNGVRLQSGKPHRGCWNKTSRRFTFHDKRTAKTYRIAKLICEAFHGPAPFPRAVAMHIDENPRNNKANNLKWGTQKDNLNCPKFLRYCRSRTGDRNPHVKGMRKRRIMIRRLVVLGCLLLGVTGTVRAQGCYPANNPTLGISTVNILSPSDYAAQYGGVTATITETAEVNGAVKSKKVTGTPGTKIDWAWTSNNGASASYTVTGGQSQNDGTFNISMNGNSYAWTLSSADVGLTPYTITFTVTAANGVKTQDRITMATVAGNGPSLTYQDGNDSNIIVLVSSNYIGTPQISFADCPAMRTAHHTPYATLQLQNPSSGEVHNTVTTAGPIVAAGNSVSSSTVDVISAMVGDTITGSYGGYTFCDVDNINFFGLQSLFRIEGAKVVVADLGHPPRVGSEKPVPSSIYDVAPICQNNCDPPDWQPTVVHSFVGRHPYWIGECQLLRAPDLDGVPWIPLCSFLTDASEAFSGGLVPSTIQLAAGGLALPYPGPAPLLPIPGKCTKYPVNVLFSVGPKDLANWFENSPN